MEGERQAGVGSVTYTIEQLPEVEQDILDLAKWLDRKEPAAADRFLIAVEETISLLRTMPGRGSPNICGIRDFRRSEAGRLRASPNILSFTSCEIGWSS